MPERAAARRPATGSGCARRGPATRAPCGPGRRTRTRPRSSASVARSARTTIHFERSKRSTRAISFGPTPNSSENCSVRWRRLHPTSSASAWTSMRPLGRDEPPPSPRAVSGADVGRHLGAARPRPASAPGRARRSAPATSLPPTTARRARAPCAPHTASSGTASPATSPAGNPNSARAPAGVRCSCTPVLVAVVLDARRRGVETAQEAPEPLRVAVPGHQRRASGASNWTMNVRCRDGRPMCVPAGNPRVVVPAVGRDVGAQQVVRATGDALGDLRHGPSLPGPTSA